MADQEERVADLVYAAARAVPAGRVVSYGQLAELVEGASVTARQVGRIMAFCPQGVPWHRVLGADGRMPIAKRDPALAALQRELLAREGVAFLTDGRVDMRQCRLGAELEQPALFESEG